MTNTFQSSPDPKVGCHLPLGALADLLLERFNPHPTRRSGATSPASPANLPQPSFQSSPDPKVGCHHKYCRYDQVLSPVSILTRPEGRVPRR